MSHALHTAQQIEILNAQAHLPVIARAAVKFAVLVTKWDTRQKTRKTLKALEPHLLDDIGLDRTSALTEAAKPFWQD